MRLILGLALAAVTAFLVLAWGSVSSLQQAAAGRPAHNAPAPGTAPVAIELSWAPTPGATGYRVTRNGGAGAVGGTCAGVVAGTSCTDTAFEPVAAYLYTVRPLLGGWVGPASRPAVATTPR